MDMKLGLCGVLAAGALAFASNAMAAQVVGVEDLVVDEYGEVYPYTPNGEGVLMPPEGHKVLVKLEWSGPAVLVSGGIYGAVEMQFFYYAPGYPHDIWGNETFFDVECTFNSGCLRSVRPGLAYGWMETPRGFDRGECTAAVVDFCSLHYYPVGVAQYGDPIGANLGFHNAAPGSTFDLVITVGDPIAVPEPATWAMMILGFGVVGLVMRQSRQSPSVRPILGGVV